MNQERVKDLMNNAEVVTAIYQNPNTAPVPEGAEAQRALVDRIVEDSADAPQMVDPAITYADKLDEQARAYLYDRYMNPRGDLSDEVKQEISIHPRYPEMKQVVQGPKASRSR